MNKRWSASGVVGILLFSFVVVSFWQASSVRANPAAPQWLTGQLKRTAIADIPTVEKLYGSADCTTGTQEVLTPISFSAPLGKKTVYSDCWRTSGDITYSMVGGTSYIKPGLDLPALWDSSNGIVVVAGGKVFSKGGGFSNIFVINNAVESHKYEEYNGNAYVTFDRKPLQAYIPEKNNTSEAIIANEFGVSENGRWMLVEQYGLFRRINLDSHESVPIDLPSLSYGYGVDPTFKLAISNDGNLATVSSSASNMAQKVEIYDLSGCDVSKIVNKIATGCKKRDITNMLVSAAATYYVIDIQFNGLGDTISYNAIEGDNFKRYSASPEGVPEHYLEYLALGDSFSSGEGDLQDDIHGSIYYLPGTNRNGGNVPSYQVDVPGFPYNLETCHISKRSYPFALAANANLSDSSFRSVACSGAVTNDIRSISSEDKYSGQFDQLKNILSTSLYDQIKQKAIDNFAAGRTAQLEFVQRYKPRVVTIGIGGNDFQFADRITECILPLTCRYAADDKYEAVSAMKSQVYENLVATYAKLKAASNTTRFYAIGYPQVVSALGQCSANVHLDSKEQLYAREVVRLLNDTVEAAAAKAGINYIDITDSLGDTALCSGKSQTTVNGLVRGDDRFGIIGSESYHPNELGHRMIANYIASYLVSQPINTFSPCTNQAELHCNLASPEFFVKSPYFNFPNDTQMLITNQDIITAADGANNGIVTRGDTVTIDNMSMNAALKPNAPVSVVLKSSPQQLATGTTDANGRVTLQVTIPPTADPGIHTIHLIGQQVSGRAIDLSQTILIRASAEDADGDGVLDTIDKCLFVEPVNIDKDGDGIDDACDGFVAQPVAVSPTNPVTPISSAVDKPVSHSESLTQGTATDTLIVDGYISTLTIPGLTALPSAQPHMNSDTAANVRGLNWLDVVVAAVVVISFATIAVLGYYKHNHETAK